MMNPKSRPEAVYTCDVYLGATLWLVIENRLIVVGRYVPFNTILAFVVST
jgi:hypothetical protein